MHSGGHAEFKHCLIINIISDFIWDSAETNNNEQLGKKEGDSESRLNTAT